MGAPPPPVVMYVSAPIRKRSYAWLWPWRTSVTRPRRNSGSQSRRATADGGWSPAVRSGWWKATIRTGSRARRELAADEGELGRVGGVVAVQHQQPHRPRGDGVPPPRRAERRPRCEVPAASWLPHAACHRTPSVREAPLRAGEVGRGRDAVRPVEVVAGRQRRTGTARAGTRRTCGASPPPARARPTPSRPSRRTARPAPRRARVRAAAGRPPPRGRRGRRRRRRGSPASRGARPVSSISRRSSSARLRRRSRAASSAACGSSSAGACAGGTSASAGTPGGGGAGGGGAGIAPGPPVVVGRRLRAIASPAPAAVAPIADAAHTLHRVIGTPRLGVRPAHPSGAPAAAILPRLPGAGRPSAPACRNPPEVQDQPVRDHDHPQSRRG